MFAQQSQVGRSARTHATEGDDRQVGRAHAMLHTERCCPFGSLTALMLPHSHPRGRLALHCKSQRETFCLASARMFDGRRYLTRPAGTTTFGAADLALSSPSP